jgi:hypothetical protein
MVTNEWLRDYFIPKFGPGIREKKNVLGWSRAFKPKLREGQAPGEPCFRVYVARKEGLEALSAADLIPKSLEGVLTDVVVIGEVRAVATNRRGVCRPVPLGVGIGNWDISEGSLGELYTRTGVSKIFAGSNAHIVAPNPFLPVGSVIEKRIIQPGAYEGERLEENVVGTYVWHKELVKMGSSKFNVANHFGELIWGLVQLILQLLRRGPKVAKATLDEATRTALEDEFNLIDFGVYETTVPHRTEVVDDVLGEADPFIGHLFAASELVGIVCKVEHIIAEGYFPLHTPAKVEDGDVVKGASFWGDYLTKVLDSSAEVFVNYGDFYARFRDVILLENDGTIKGGWSGSGFRLLKVIG